jgi:hypothetical protein
VFATLGVLRIVLNEAEARKVAKKVKAPGGDGEGAVDFIKTIVTTLLDEVHTDRSRSTN